MQKRKGCNSGNVACVKSPNDLQVWEQTNKQIPADDFSLALSPHTCLLFLNKKTQYFHFQTKIMGDKIKENTFGSTNGFLRNRVSNQVRVPRLQTQRV